MGDLLLRTLDFCPPLCHWTDCGDWPMTGTLPLPLGGDLLDQAWVNFLGIDRLPSHSC